ARRGAAAGPSLADRRRRPGRAEARPRPTSGESGAMAERFIRASHLRSLLPAVLLLAPALAVATILIGAFTGAERPSGADGVAPAEAATHGDWAHGRGAKTITIGWVGDITPGSQYGLPANGG